MIVVPSGADCFPCVPVSLSWMVASVKRVTIKQKHSKQQSKLVKSSSPSLTVMQKVVVL